MPQALAAAGYATGHVGKWNITPDPRPYVDEAFAVMNWKGAYYPDENGTYLGVDEPDFRMESHGWGPPQPGAEYLTDSWSHPVPKLQLGNPPPRSSASQNPHNSTCVVTVM